MDLACIKCRRVSWNGDLGVVLEGVPGGVVIEAAGDWTPSGRWVCSQCGHVVRNPSPKQNALDGAVQAWLLDHEV